MTIWYIMLCSGLNFFIAETSCGFGSPRKIPNCIEAEFSIFRHTAEQPLFAIAKVPGSGNGGGYMVYNGPRKLAQGETLEDVLRIFDRKLKLLLS